MRKQLDIGYTFSLKKLLTLQDLRQQHVHMVCSVLLPRHEALIVPLTVLLHYTIANYTYTILLVLQLGIHVLGFCYSFD